MVCGASKIKGSEVPRSACDERSRVRLRGCFMAVRFQVSGVRCQAAEQKAKKRRQVGSATVPTIFRRMQSTEFGGHSGPPYSEVHPDT